MADYSSWAWLTNKKVSDTNPKSFVNYEFDPNTIYHKAILRDGDDDGRIGARDGGAFYHPNDGWGIAGNAYNLAQNWSFNATVTLKNGDTTNAVIDGSRLVDDQDDATKPYHGTMLFRLADERMKAVADGGTDNGDGEYLYNMDDIASIKIISLRNDAAWLPRQNLDEFWPEAICFARGTLIETFAGHMPIEKLRKNDLVMTRDNGLQPLRWIGSQKYSTAVLRAKPKLKPIRIAAGALGKKTPTSDLIVSPQHRVLVRSKIAERMFGSIEVLVAAKQLLELDGVEVAPCEAQVEYFHFLFDQHEIVFANGAEAESLHTGPQALRSVSKEAREEIFAIFPELQDQDYVANAARPLVSGRAARQFASRHVKNNRELVA